MKSTHPHCRGLEKSTRTCQPRYPWGHAHTSVPTRPCVHAHVYTPVPIRPCPRAHVLMPPLMHACPHANMPKDTHAHGGVGQPGFVASCN
eukprot:23775-Chlamydomonas_euryale.AAC.3